MGTVEQIAELRAAINRLEDGSPRDHIMAMSCSKTLDELLAQLEARTTDADPFARTWRDFTAGWAAARNAPTQDERETDCIARDAAAERWETALRHSKEIVAKEGVKS